MRTGVHYERAPILEAIIEIRCALPPSTSLERLATVVDSQEFPVVEKRVTVTGLLDVRPDGVEQRTSGEHTGHLFRSADGRHVLQSRLDGYSFARLAPYETWESFYEEAERHWFLYREVAQPIRATRIGVRYINRIDVPGEHVEVKDYLRTAIDVSPYLPQLMSGYFLQVGIPLPQFRALAAVTSTIVEAEPMGGTGLILDIDTSHEVDIDLSAPGAGAEIDGRLETLRLAKNYVFEASITDATRRLIE